MTCHMERETRLKPHASLHLPKPVVEQPCGFLLLAAQKAARRLQEISSLWETGLTKPYSQSSNKPYTYSPNLISGHRKSSSLLWMQIPLELQNRYNHVKFWFCKGVHLLMNKLKALSEMTPAHLDNRLCSLCLMLHSSLPFARWKKIETKDQETL